MRYAAIATVALCAAMLSPGRAGAAELSSSGTPRAVKMARTTTIPACTSFVDGASKGGGGTAQAPHTKIAGAVEAAQSGAIICVAEGTYAEQIAPGEKFFTLAGGFQRGSGFKVRDSAKFVSKAQGKGQGSFLRIGDPGPKGGLTAIDGFEITGYSQGIVREFYEPQRFDVTNNHIHDNTCTDPTFVGGAFALHNVSGSISGNVIRKNACGRGGAGFLNDATNNNTVKVESNLVDANSGTEVGAAHGGGMNLGGNKLSIVGNEFINNTVTQWGGGLYIGAFTPGNQVTTATLSWNVYRGNRAGDSGGGFFCDDGAVCIASHEVYDRNCGHNVLLDGGAGGSAATRATFDHVTNVGALDVGCGAPGIGLFVDTYDGQAADTYAVTNSIFWGNAPEKDFATSCGKGCSAIKVSVSSSLVQKKFAKDGGINIAFGSGIIDSVDPQFVAADKGDFRLGPGSPATGNARDGTDLGAFGSSGAAPPPSAAAETTPEHAAPAPPKAAAAKVESEPAVAAPSAPVDAPVAAYAAADDISTKEAFTAAKDLGTVEAWNAFLARYPAGFYTDLARAYLRKLGGGSATEPAPASPPPAKAAAPKAPPAAPAEDAGAAPVPAGPGKPANVRRIRSAEEFSAALGVAVAGDEIVLEPGTYAGQLTRDGLRQVTIRSADPANPAVIEGGDYGLHLTDPVQVTLSDLVFQGQAQNGINIDDAGSFETPARAIRLIRITVKDMVKSGNHDAIKMSGVEDFLIDGARIENWGNDGSAVDFVGCRNGLVQNSLLIHTALKAGGSGIRPKGGTKNVVIRANRIELPVATGRAIQAGGSTDAEFFRFAEGDKDYEADRITIEGNVVVGGGAAFSWVNIDGGIVHHNLVQGPAPWVMRILNENEGSAIVVTKNGQFHDNDVAFETGGTFNTAVNIGDGTEPDTFRFARNHWLNLADPTPDGSRPKLPTKEINGVYGEALRNAPDRVQIWEFPWGKWLVNATAEERSVEVPDHAQFKHVLGGKAARFSSLDKAPLAGSWTAVDLPGESVTLPAMSQVILINPETCSGCLE